MRRSALLVCLIVGLATVAVSSSQIAGAQSVERIQIADPVRTAHGLPPGLLIELSSPPDYNRQSVSGNSGRWTGPRYEQIGNPGNAGFASMDWTVSFDESQGDAKTVALGHVIQHAGWQVDQREWFSIEHVVGKRVLGTLLGYYVLMTPSTPGAARYEGVLAFPLDVNLWAIVQLELLEPPDDTFVVNGSFRASTWNRGQAILAFTGVQLSGNLPPKIVAVRAYQGGRLLKGKVVDRFLAPVIGAPVSLERQAGSWTKVAGSKTSQQGFYSLRPRGRGTYRVTARIAEFSATSRVLRAGG